MTSQAQIDANRRNSKKSTGPKDTSLTSSNALKHGLTANRFVVLPGENLSEYEALVDRMYEDYKPQTVFEEVLIDRMANAVWRQWRLTKSENVKIEERLAYASLDYASKEAQRRIRAITGGYGDFAIQPQVDLDALVVPDAKTQKAQWLQENGPIREDDNEGLKVLKTTSFLRHPTGRLGIPTLLCRSPISHCRLRSELARDRCSSRQAKADRTQHV